MFRPWFFNKTATVERQTTVSWKTTFSTTGESYSWYLKPLQSQDEITLENFWKTFNFTTDQDADIREWDNLTIDAEVYSVKWVAPWNWITIKYKRLLIVKK